MPAVSILMPMRNAAPFITQTLQSIIAQTLTDWELIIIDDHSEDQSAQLISRSFLVDPRIKLFKNEGKGIISALRKALAESRSSVITRMDADDLMFPKKLECMLKALEKASVVTAQVEYFREDQPLGDGYQRYAAWLNGLVDNHDHWAHIYKECVIASPCWMMLKEDLERIGAFNSDTYPEDYDLVFRMYAGRLKVKGIKEILHQWRDHSERSSRTDPHYTDNRFLDLKIRYFLKLDYNPGHRLILWGAGKKGKYLAQLLHSLEIPFHWHTDNKKKWGKEIHGTFLEEISDFTVGDQVIIAVANADEQRDIRSFLIKTGVQGLYFFC